MNQEPARHPTEVAAELGISVATLRRWSRQFARFLSAPSAESPAEGDASAAPRRYTPEDLETLLTIKRLLAEGLTYPQVEERLEALRLEPKPEGDAYALVAADDERPSLSPAVAVLADTLHTVAQAQQAVLNSQQTNRDLLGVVIQDNFNLKAENAKLRDRMLELERELSELRRRSESEREALEARLQALEAMLAGTVPSASVSQPKAAPSPRKKKGFWARLLGDADEG